MTPETSTDPEQESYEQHARWFAGCDGDQDAIAGAAESMSGVPNVEEAALHATEQAEQHERQAARWRGIARAAQEQVGVET